MIKPEKWMILKIDGIDKHYRVFGSWSGGYLDSDEWRMNSGIVSVTEDEDFFYFKGYSGSVYKCRKGMYGTSSYGMEVASNYVKTYNGLIEIMDEDNDWMELFKRKGK